MVEMNTTTDKPVISFTNHIQDDIKHISYSVHAQYLPPQGMSRASQILPFLPFGSSTLWAWSKDGKRFPKPIRLSPTMTAWRNADVIEWLNNKNASINDEV